MKTRKILAGLMALTCLTATTAMMASAEETPITAEGTPTEKTFTTTIQAPTISVSLPTSLEVVYNPYRIEVDSSTDSVISNEYEVTSTSDCAVKVAVTVTGVIPEGCTAKFATAAYNPAKPTTDKSAFLYVESKGAEGYAEAYAKNANQILVGAKPVTVEGFLALEKESGTAAFKLMGETNPSATGWTENDKLGVTMAFSVTAIPNVEATE